MLHRRARATAEVEMVGKKDDHDEKEEEEKMRQEGGGATATPFTLFDQVVSCRIGLSLSRDGRAYFTLSLPASL